MGGYFPQIEIVAHTSPRALDDPGVGQYPPYLYFRGHPAHVLALGHLLQACPVLQAVDDVLEHPILAGRAAATVEESGPERFPLLQHEILLLFLLFGPCLDLLLWDAGV